MHVQVNTHGGHRSPNPARRRPAGALPRGASGTGRRMAGRTPAPGNAGRAAAAARRAASRPCPATAPATPSSPTPRRRRSPSPSDSTSQSGASWLATLTVACGWLAAKPSPGSGPGRPGRPAPSPTPGSSAMISISAGPPSGWARTAPRRSPVSPVRSSPAPMNPLTSQPDGSGQGSQTGTFACRTSTCRPSIVGRLRREKGVNFAVQVTAPRA